MTNWKKSVVGFGHHVDAVYDGWMDTDEFGKVVSALIRDQLVEEMDDDLDEILTEIEMFDHRESWDYIDACLEGLYDWADENRIWIDPSK